MNGQKPRIAIYGGSFNPPGLHHEEIVKRLAGLFDKVLIVPCGSRPNKPLNVISGEHRKAMTELAFTNGVINRIEFDFTDLDSNEFTPTYDLHERYQKQFPDAELWYVVGGDIVKGGTTYESEIQKTWKRGDEVWRTLNFVVITHENCVIRKSDLPPSAYSIELTSSVLKGRSTLIRERITQGQPIDGLVSSKVAEYIQSNSLYRI
ncbi:nicotinate-nicotinamide nucleotide adenylyltransferase [Candidatus Jorgensenbacteria bacterium]|nr:nicotinate-nicotinamide nucleotide adenylyltransferase [Candidatus Jorgensenbacteria bacterium]